METSGLHMEERRTAIELLAIRERLQHAAVTLKWVNSGQELADSLTKPWRHEGLIQALQVGWWRITFDPAYRSAKRVRALRKSQSDSSEYFLFLLWDLATETQAKRNWDE